MTSRLAIVLLLVAALGSSQAEVEQCSPRDYPSSKDITAFASNPMPSGNSDNVEYILPFEYFTLFLDLGKKVDQKTAFKELKDQKSLWPLIAGAALKKRVGIKQFGMDYNIWDILRCEGVAATDHAIIHWRLLARDILEIDSEHQKPCFLVIPEGAKPVKTQGFKKHLLENFPLGEKQKPIRVIHFAPDNY